jgi:hypothetical protein
MRFEYGCRPVGGRIFHRRNDAGLNLGRVGLTPISATSDRQRATGKERSATSDRWWLDLPELCRRPLTDAADVAAAPPDPARAKNQ